MVSCVAWRRQSRQDSSRFIPWRDFASVVKSRRFGLTALPPPENSKNSSTLFNPLQKGLNAPALCAIMYHYLVASTFGAAQDQVSGETMRRDESTARRTRPSGPGLRTRHVLPEPDWCPDEGTRVVLFDIDRTLMRSCDALHAARTTALAELRGVMAYDFSARPVAFRTIYDASEIQKLVDPSRHRFEDRRPVWNSQRIVLRLGLKDAKISLFECATEAIPASLWESACWISVFDTCFTASSQ